MWNVNCGGLITQAKGVISSPRYSTFYGETLTCNYTILAPGEVIFYQFVDFSLYEGKFICFYFL